MDRVENQQAINAEAKLAAAVRFHRDGHLLKAGQICREILDRFPDHSDTLHMAGMLAHQKGDDKDAVELIAKAIHIVPDNPFYHNNLGRVFKALGEHEKAITSFNNAIAINPNYAEAHYNLGALFQLENEFDRAIVFYRKAIKIQPDLSEAYASTGIILQLRGEFESAAQSFRNALAIRPQDAELLHHLARVLEDLGKFTEAIQCYRQALEIQPYNAEVFNDMGLVLRQQGKFAEALSSFQKAIEIKPEGAEACNNLGNLFQDGGRLEEAGKCYLKALAIQPNFAKAYNNLGVVHQHRGKSEEAVACFRKAIEIRPDYASAYRHLVHQLQKDCSWPEMAAPAARLDHLTEEALAAGKRPAEDPFLNLTRRADPAINMAVARAWSADICHRMAGLRPEFSFNDHRCGSTPITIGYLSNNFHDHPTAHLLFALFSLHNRNQFKINCYSCGKEDDSYYRQRIYQDCDKFTDLRDMSYLQAADAIYNDRVDILVDLMGHTSGSRMEICALRPAPIQVRYLGLAGTTGADFFDYILTDKIVTPEAHAPFYSENFAYLPYCYQINGYKLSDGKNSSTSGQQELPDNRFVFCSFSQDYKIESTMFACWMRILKQVPDSILWLMVRHQTAVENLRNEARKSGINPNRLVFVQRLSKSDHIARLSKADLALDTRVVNGAATTSDALWAGVPVITLMGTHFASRMSASILTAVGLPELIAHSLKEYEAIAVQTACDRERLDGLRRQLAEKRLTEPLFDTPRNVKNLEKAYQRMWQLFQTGAKPRQFEVVESLPVHGQNYAVQPHTRKPGIEDDPLAFLSVSGCQNRSVAIPQNGFSMPAKPDDSAIVGIQPTRRPRKIAFFCGPNDSFLKEIVGHLARNHQVKWFKGRSINDMQAMMQWSDLSWFEWCDDMVRQASMLPKVCRILCRLHSYEIFTDLPEQVNWHQIDDLVFVAPHIRDIALNKIADLKQKVRLHIIDNGIDLDKYTFSARSKGFDIAYVGYLNYKKNPPLLLQCIRHLVDIDHRYILHIAGEHQELRSKLYFDHMIGEMALESNVKFYGWVNNISVWLRGKQYILSTSLLESFGYGIAEAMACGLKPLIHNFIGAKELYPEKYCFNSIKEFGALVLDDDFRSAEYRRYIEEKYSRPRQLQAIENLLESYPGKTGTAI